MLHNSAYCRLSFPLSLSCIHTRYYDSLKDSTHAREFLTSFLSVGSIRVLVRSRPLIPTVYKYTLCGEIMCASTPSSFSSFLFLFLSRFSITLVSPSSMASHKAPCLSTYSLFARAHSLFLSHPHFLCSSSPSRFNLSRVLASRFLAAHSPLAFLN